ncbi:MAG: hypothetical protein R6V61_01785 [Wenzhouxiangellaceae bacterium]
MSGIREIGHELTNSHRQGDAERCVRPNLSDVALGLASVSRSVGVHVICIKKADETRFGNFIGPVDALQELAERFGKAFLKGHTAAAQLFSPG